MTSANLGVKNKAKTKVMQMQVRSLISEWGKWDLGDFDPGIVIGARQAGGISETADLLELSRTIASGVYTV